MSQQTHAMARKCRYENSPEALDHVNHVDFNGLLVSSGSPMDTSYLVLTDFFFYQQGLSLSSASGTGSAKASYDIDNPICAYMYKLRGVRTLVWQGDGFWEDTAILPYVCLVWHSCMVRICGIIVNIVSWCCSVLCLFYAHEY